MTQRWRQTCMTRMRKPTARPTAANNNTTEAKQLQAQHATGQPARHLELLQAACATTVTKRMTAENRLGMFFIKSKQGQQNPNMNFTPPPTN